MWGAEEKGRVCEKSETCLGRNGVSGEREIESSIWEKRSVKARAVWK